MEYWIMIDGQRTGPLTYEEVLRSGIRPDTPVWRTGLADWQAASTFPEFACHFKDTLCGNRSYGPGAGTVYPAMEEEPMPPTYLGWSIAAMLLCCLIPGIVAIIYSAKVSSRYARRDYAGARKASERAGLWIIISLVCGLISIPFQLVLMLMG